MRDGLQNVVPDDDTIVAISTPFGRSGIGVVRVSGILAKGLGRQFFRSTRKLEHGKAVTGRWMNSSGDVIDQVIVTLFEGPLSYTGQDVLEISAHGNPLVLGQIVRSIQSAGARPAKAGEFTLRAVCSGKMDLIQAEAVRTFVEAQTEGQARTAMRQMEGALSKRVTPLKERLTDLIAHLEAGIDFAEDNDLELPDPSAAAATLSDLAGILESLRATFSYGRLLDQGLSVVIAGKPNVGKSSLFNCLVELDRAIVTPIPGTTRDVISERTNLDGIPLRLFDTAGVRETGDAIERMGVARTREALADADLVLLVIDGSAPLDEQDRQIQMSIQRVPHLVIANKSDLPQVVQQTDLERLKAVRLSAQTGQGLDALRDAIRNFLGTNPGAGGSDPIITSVRQKDAVEGSAERLQAGRAALLSGVPSEMVLLDLYQALTFLNELTGETTTDDILDKVFSTFCIGK